MSSYRTALTWVNSSTPNINAANLNSLETALAAMPVGEIAYAQVTADQGSITTEADLTSLTITTPSIPSSRKLLILGTIGAYSTVASDDVQLQLYKDGSLVQARTSAPLSNAVRFAQVDVLFRDTPAAGAHTYKLTLQRRSGTGTITMHASANAPAFIMAIDQGT